MRDLLIIMLVAAGAVMALKRPWIGIMLWTWLSIMNPHRYAWGFAASAPVAMIAALSTLVGLLFTQERQSPFKGAPVWFLAAFVVWMTISWLAGVDPAGDQALWDRSIKIFLMTFVALALLNNKHHIMAFVWVTVGSLAILGAKGGLFTVITGGGYRVWGPSGSFIEGNNEFALALIMIIPLLHFLQLQARNKWVRHGISATMLLCVAASLGSHSRGALLAIVAMGAMFWWRSPRKGLMSVLIVVAVLALAPMMPESWWSRMGTIETYQEDGSAIGRINAWIVAWEVATRYFFGSGMSYQYAEFFYAYGTYETTVRAAHSIYFQVLGNHGFIGLGLFLFIWFTTYHTAGWLRKHARDIPEAKWAGNLGAMIQVGLVGYAAGGAFLSLAYFDLPYNMMVMAVLARQWVENRGWERDPQAPFLEYAGLKRRSSSAIPSGATASRSASGA
ncbi:MAG TPA: putative O-glycosylation ligase, exosortase A system-associated [Candidatus Competibacteraceae bacterium]|nr:putative O-glycosylation ligase, exosortase A system-associated [Candidatus Competibacter sp.]MDG4605289.1 putative O-glycosylation ligase, exosortase A system-associated [Candidatus Contendobacter sp.]HRD48160.1 putative O-glycosylation ligase, exosortase A system-associated [Candidatus Contendobacter sp.]HRF45829.1 putative O-glycosylation ligase, exosortase A system-associated [Candidatus Competibacteraceae bacterium]